VPSLCIALGVLTFVSINRGRIPRLYALKHTHGDVPKTPASWVIDFCRAKDIDLITHQSLDAYLLLRYLRFCILLCLGGCATLCSVLLPLNATGSGGMSQLNRLTLANIKGGSSKLYAHACCTSVYFGWVMLMLARERVFYIRLKHANLMCSVDSNRSKSRTVLFTNVPKKLQSVDAVKQCFETQGQLDVWLVTATKSLRRDTKRRDALVDKLDTIRSGQGRQTSWASRLDSCNISRTPEQVKNDGPPGTSSLTTGASETSSEARLTSEIKKLWIDKKRALHRELSLGINPAIQQSTHDSYEKSPPLLLPSVFVRFDTVERAQLAFRSRHHDRLSKFTPRCIDTAAKEIIWTNLGLTWVSRIWRGLLSQLLIVALIIFWSFPVAFATAMTNIDMLLPSIRWRERSSGLVQNAVDGLLPSLLISLLMTLPPMVISLLGRFSGLVSRAEVENYLHRYYFWFRIVQVFLVAALGSTASSVLTQIYSHPSSVTTILAKRLPGASNFYFSYLVVQGFSESAFVLLNFSGLFSRCILTRMFDDTPGKKARRLKGTFEVSVGTVLSICSSLLIIALCYAPAAPLMLCFGTVAFTMFYLVYRYNMFFTVDPTADTEGRLYLRALKHTLVGIYLGELFLVGLLTISAIDGQKMSWPLVISCTLLVSTVFYQKKTEDVFRQWEARVPNHQMIMNFCPSDSRDQWQRQHHIGPHWWSSLIGIFLDSWGVVQQKLAEEDYASTNRVDVEGYLAPEVIGPDES
jgi:hypothetical protein